MSYASTLPSLQTWPKRAGRRPSPSPLDGDALYMLALRSIAHLPYFKIASMLVLPQGISNGGLLVTTLVYALACMVASRWSAGLRRVAAELPHRAVLPLLGTTAVFITMLVVGPVIASLLPRHPELAAGALLPAYVCLIVPACTIFFAAQYLNAPRRSAVC